MLYQCHVCEFDSKIHDANKESEGKNIDHAILENEWVVAEFMKKSIISCYVGQFLKFNFIKQLTQSHLWNLNH